jgi:hypothetical protein
LRSPIEIDGTAAELAEVELELVELLVELLQAAAARHKASDDEITSPFLAT